MTKTKVPILGIFKNGFQKSMVFVPTLINKEIYFNDSLTSIHTYKHDMLHNIIDETWQNASGKTDKTFHYKYIFDDKNNWIKRMEYIDSNLLVIRQRIIKYY